jgi:hypothetical protein
MMNYKKITEYELSRLEPFQREQLRLLDRIGSSLASIDWFLFGGCIWIIAHGFLGK